MLCYILSIKHLFPVHTSFLKNLRYLKLIEYILNSTPLSKFSKGKHSLFLMRF